MLNYKIMLASFALVFLAELGDKTQLTALAFSASSRSPFSVFIGTALALVCTTALAVFLGNVLSNHLPEKIIVIGSAVGFILVGVVLLVNVARKAPGKPLPTSHAAETEHGGKKAPGEDGAGMAQGGALLFKTVMRHAMAFEEDFSRALVRVAEQLPPGPVREELDRIAAEEEMHRAWLRDLSGNETPSDSSTVFRAPATPELVEFPRAPAWSVSVEAPLTPAADGPSAYAPLFRDLLETEEGAAAFYLALSRLALIPSVRAAFRRLAAEELGHVERLNGLLELAKQNAGNGDVPSAGTCS